MKKIWKSDYVLCFLIHYFAEAGYDSVTFSEESIKVTGWASLVGNGVGGSLDREYGFGRLNR